jgi:phospholipid/cholesterol/gamma-HCH transport system substrate-binding protein
MARDTRWTELTIGILATLGVLTVAGLILVFGRVGELHGRKFTMYVTTDAARGLIRGTEVWLDGQRIGSVSGVDFRPPSVNTKERLVIALRLLEQPRPHIRRNSKVQVRAGTSLIGDQVVFLSSGTLDQPVIREGDTLRAVEQTDMEGLSSEAAMAAKQFPAIIANVKLLGAQLRAATGTLGAMGADDGTVNFESIREHTQRLLGDLVDSRGTMWLAVRNSNDWRAAAINALSVADSLRTLAFSNDHSLGRFRRDSTLGHNVAEARASLAKVEALASSPDGTFGRLRTDSAIVLAVRRDRLALDSLMQDIKRRPLRYIAF